MAARERNGPKGILFFLKIKIAAAIPNIDPKKRVKIAPLIPKKIDMAKISFTSPNPNASFPTDFPTISPNINRKSEAAAAETSAQTV